MHCQISGISAELKSSVCFPVLIFVSDFQLLHISNNSAKKLSDAVVVDAVVFTRFVIDVSIC
jgi:hypothetical protein